MPPTAPTQEEWEGLYEAAVEFQKLRPWEWMSDEDLFGVQDPESGVIGYCCVLGALGEVFALAVYLGPEGLDCYLRMQSGELDERHTELVYLQKCLMASFEDRQDLDKSDLKVIKSLGLKFRGRSAWPQFRSYQPGYVPWHLNGTEARFLTTALQQAIQICQRVGEDEEVLVPPEEDQVLVRIAQGNDAAAPWRDVWMDLPEFEPQEISLSPIERDRLEVIRKEVRKIGRIWEVDFFFISTAVNEGDRPFFPRILVVLDHAKGFVLDTWLAPPWEFLEGCRPRLVDLLEQQGAAPRRILVASDEARVILEPIAAALRIELVQVKALRAARDLRNSLETRL